VTGYCRIHFAGGSTPCRFFYTSSQRTRAERTPLDAPKWSARRVSALSVVLFGPWHGPCVGRELERSGHEPGQRRTNHRAAAHRGGTARAIHQESERHIERARGAGPRADPL